MDAMLACAMSAAIQSVCCFHPMPDDPATTMGASRRQRMDRTFETIEYMGFVPHPHFEALIIRIATDFTGGSLAA
jgi:hypothetical protein